MDLREMYERINGDYDSIFSRLHNDERIKKFLAKFADSKMDTAIQNALDACDYETAFREAHTLKGVCANLSLSALERSSSALTEALRGRKENEAIAPLAKATMEDYAMTIAALRELLDA